MSDRGGALRRAPSPPRLAAGDRLRLAAEIAVALWEVRRVIGRERLPEAVERLRAARGVRSRLPLPDPARDGVRLGRAMTRTLRLVPVRTQCLVRSLVLLRLLAARGVAAQLVISAVTSERAPLDAHAWVELDGRPLLAPGPESGRLVVL